VTEIMKQNATAVQIIAVDDGVVSAAADPRKYGSALAQ
jgi:gamma-glutamyltranspeptidase